MLQIMWSIDAGECAKDKLLMGKVYHFTAKTLVKPIR